MNLTSSVCSCPGPAARAEAFANRAQLNAIDWIEVSEDQLTVFVHFMGAVPAVASGANPAGLTAANVRVQGGEAVTGIVVSGLAVLGMLDDGGAAGSTPGAASAGPSSNGTGDTQTVDSSDAAGESTDACLAVSVDRRGDFSRYTLILGAPGTGTDSAWGPLPGFDPRFAQACFGFKAGCPTGVDCVRGCPGQGAPAPEPDIDYLAKDYESFRRLMLDRLAATMPHWQERHAADVGIAIVEVLAYAADELSYYQDAVATEAYLRTARRRVSVRRHVRLVDYYLHEGLNARAWLTVWTNADTPAVDASGLFFITGFPALTVPFGSVLTQDMLENLPDGNYTVFEPVDTTATGIVFQAACSEIEIDTAGGDTCVLPAGTTGAVLVDKALWRAANPDAPLPAAWSATMPTKAMNLAAGDVLILEEVRGPATGDPADADPAHRQAVTLTSVNPVTDGGWLVAVAWDRADALTFNLCLATRTAAPGCAPVERIGVARGNTILVDHGRTVTDPPWDPVPTLEITGECCCEGSAVEETAIPGPITPALAQSPITHTDAWVRGAASAASVRDPRAALPAVELAFTDPDTGSATLWRPQQSLLESGPLDREFVAEIDDAGLATLRFGDGDLGAQPAAGLLGTASYRVGNGTAGNVGRDSITFLVLRNASWSGVQVSPRNPLAAFGGMDGESVAQARLLAPDAFRMQLLRAITADDYAALAGAQPGLQRAAAQLAWTGSWFEARVGIDPWGTEDPPAQLLSNTQDGLRPYRRMGHDLAVTAAAYVPVEVELGVCVLPHYIRGDIRGTLLQLLGSGTGPDGQPAFFNPDRLTFGAGVYVSSLVAAAQSVAGVESVVVTKLQRQGKAPNHELENGVLGVGPMEIVRLDNSPDFPDHGTLTLTIGGGL
ncbi:putative baseplate assembly protein [Arthrobacter sp. LAPM80]|uniref:putative baseplate assembly protein n=1 Tax=Arthrobacter sp. LAPM80 TaxID=3141788 RepID=UPI00398BA1BE